MANNNHLCVITQAMICYHHWDRESELDSLVV